MKTSLARAKTSQSRSPKPVSDEARAQDVLVSSTALSVTLTDGRLVSVPLGWYPRLLHGTPSERNQWELSGEGTAIHWPMLDEDLSVEGIVAGRRSMEGRRSFTRWLDYRSRGQLPPVPTLPLPDWFEKELRSSRPK